LLLRPFAEADAEGLAAHRSHPDVARHCPWTPPYPLDKARSLIADAPWTGERTPGAGNVVAIELVESGEVIGDCAYILEDTDDPPPDQASIGFTLAPSHQGGGYATEAVRALLGYLFDELGLHRVWAVCGVENTASWRLMERLGMRREAHHVDNIYFKGAWDSEFTYAMLAREWAAMPGRSCNA